MEDKFDGKQAKNMYVNLNEIAERMYSTANPRLNDPVAKFSIEEKTIRGVQNLNEL
jgi:hypothetical protein